MAVRWGSTREDRPVPSTVWAPPLTAGVIILALIIAVAVSL